MLAAQTLYEERQALKNAQKRAAELEAAVKRMEDVVAAQAAEEAAQASAAAAAPPRTEPSPVKAESAPGAGLSRCNMELCDTPDSSCPLRQHELLLRQLQPLLHLPKQSPRLSRPAPRTACNIVGCCMIV